MKISKELIKNRFQEFSQHGYKYLTYLGEDIRNEISDLKLFGEIDRPEGKTTYDTLRDSLKKWFKIRKICNLDPETFWLPEHRAVISLYFVWAGVFHYGDDGGHDLWPHVFGELGFEHNSGLTTQLGKLFFKCLEENDMELFPKITGGRKYVTRILLHGLIPGKYIRKFIDSYIRGELSTVRARYFTGQTLIDNWSNGVQLQTQPVPIQKFIRHGHPINAYLVERFWEMIENWEEDGNRSWWRWGLPKYMVDAFKLCMENSPGNPHTIKRTRTFVRRPCFMFDFQNHDFPTLHIPSQPVSPGSRLKIESRTLNRKYEERYEEIDTIPIEGESIFQNRNIRTSPSMEWKIVLSKKDHKLVYQFPEDISEAKIPVFLFNSSSGKAINFVQGRVLPNEVIIVFHKDASLDIEGGEVLTEPMSLSHKWHEWNFAIYQIRKNGTIGYEGPDIGLSRKIKTDIIFSGKKDDDVPFLECGRATPSWMRTDGSLQIVTDIERLAIRFSKTARKKWRRGTGCLIRLDVPDRKGRYSYFQLNLNDDRDGFFSRPAVLAGIDPGVHEIRLRGALGVEDVVLPFVYLPLSKCKKRGAKNAHEIAKRFVLDFTVPVDMDVHQNTAIQWHGKNRNRTIIELENDRGDAFCALKLFRGSRFPVTLLLARNAVRWVRRSEKKLFHWYDWRVVAEEIPIDRLKELRDTRVLVEIDTFENTKAQIDKRNKRLKVFLKNMTDPVKYDHKELMSFNAPSYKRGLRDIWVLDLQKFSDQMKSVENSGHAELVLKTWDSSPETVMFRLLRYSEFKNFKLVSKGVKTGKEIMKADWTPHPNEARLNRIVTLASSNTEQHDISHKIPDNANPPIIIKLDIPEKPAIWTAKIEVRQSRFGGRFSKKIKNASYQWLRMPQNWMDWPETADLSHDRLPSDFLKFMDIIKSERAWQKMLWSSFLLFFHKGDGHNNIEKLIEILGPDLTKRIFPFSKGKILKIRDERKLIARMRISSDMDIQSQYGKCFKSQPPSGWCRIPEDIEFEFSLAGQSPGTGWLFTRTWGREPVMKNCDKEVPFSRWLADEQNFRGLGHMVQELPLQTIWTNPLTPAIVQKLNCKDSFSYETICLDDNIDGIQPFHEHLGQRRNEPTAMVEALAKCLKSKKAGFDQAGTLLPKIDKKTKNAFHSLVDRWNKCLNTSIDHPLMKKMIEQRMNQNPLQALSGAAALMSRFQAQGYSSLIERFDCHSLLGETRNFAVEYLSKSFLRDLILSEIMISWYWNKRYFEFRAAPAVEIPATSQKKHVGQLMEQDVKQGDKTQSDKTMLESRPRKFSGQEVNRIWRQKGFFKPDSKSEILISSKLEDKRDGTIFDSRTGLMWLKQGIQKVSWQDARKYVNQLNRDRRYDYDDWRMPTLEELGSLLVPAAGNTNGYNAHYISSLFDRKLIICWSADTSGNDGHWYLSYFTGQYDNTSSLKNCVRAVRTSQPDQEIADRQGENGR